VSARGPAALLALALAAVAPVRAQEFLDRGTFVIERAGNEVGREDFAVRRTAGGGPGAILAVATVHYRDRDLRPALELTGDLAPVSYQVDISAGGRVVERFGAQFAHGRIAARLATQLREVLREFPAPGAVAVLDDDTFHQYLFLPRGAAGGTRTLRILLPREPALVDASVTREGPDTVTVAGRTLSADRFALRLEDGEVRHFWLTPGGDLLRVAIPRRDLLATRTALPPS
jgi:hypothetical protein